MGVFKLVDDILTYGEDPAQLHWNVRMVFQRRVYPQNNCTAQKLHNKKNYNSKIFLKTTLQMS